MPVDSEDAAPIEIGMGLVAVQLETHRFVGGLRIGEVIPTSLTPPVDEPVGHRGHGQGAAALGAEIPGAGIGRGVLPEGGAEEQITVKGFQNVLPGPDGVGVANADGPPAAEGADAVGDEAGCHPSRRRR